MKSKTITAYISKGSKSLKFKKVFGYKFCVLYLGEENYFKEMDVKKVKVTIEEV